MYLINAEMLGPDADSADAQAVVAILQGRGCAVGFTADSGLVDGSAPNCPVSDADWTAALRIVAALKKTT